MSRLTAAAEGEACVRCGSIGTTVSCHYSGLRQHAYGKGRGIKGADLAAADLCMECHSHFDSYETPNDWERSEEFLHCCMLTILRRYAKGILR